MLIEVVIHPGSSQNKIIKKENTYHIYVHSQPEKGKANRESIESLAEYFNVSKRSIVIQRGETSRKKIIQLELISK
jgi:hypothetical protein